ncbi:hypothetical protein LJB78_01445, partial [Bacteroidales bacterium OttesenSCG-928-J16]|nr:hypothetical protein [Bacteroidales bacterium OttesenSCG-928-J16]
MNIFFTFILLLLLFFFAIGISLYAQASKVLVTGGTYDGQDVVFTDMSKVTFISLNDGVIALKVCG